MINEPELLAYAANLNITCTDPQDAGIWFRAAGAFFDRVTAALKRPGVVIGHNKGFLELDNGAFAYLSNAGLLGTDVRSQGEGQALKGRLGFNVLLYGSDEYDVQCRVEVSVAELEKELSAQCTLEKAADEK